MENTKDQTTTVAQKLKGYFAEQGLTQQALAERLGVKQQNVGQLLLGNRPFGNRTAMKWHDEFGFSIKWLMTGEGPMMDEDAPEPTHIELKETPLVLVPVVPTEAQAGHLCDFTASVQEYECEKMISPVRDATLAMAVYGDSMFPEYPSGSRVLLKKVNEKAFIEWGKVYVLDTENGAVIKEIHKCDDESCIECVSLNPDEKYAPFKVAKSSIFGWYKVIMVLSYK